MEWNVKKVKKVIKKATKKWLGREKKVERSWKETDIDEIIKIVERLNKQMEENGRKLREAGKKLKETDRKLRKAERLLKRRTRIER